MRDQTSVQTRLSSDIGPAQEGIAMDELPVGAVVDVETGSHTYRLENCGEGKVLIAGHPLYCPEPLLVDLHGSVGGEPMLKMSYIGRGMKMAFQHPRFGVVLTSRVRAIREQMSPGIWKESLA